MNKFYVYVHRRASDNLPFYVGKGKDKRAWNFHHRSAFWNNVKQKHGIIVEIVFENLSENEAFQCEKDTILEFRHFGYPLVNLTDGGEGPAGRKFSEQSRKRMSEAQRTSLRVKAAREKVSAQRRGVSVGRRPKTSIAMRGQEKSASHRQAVAESKRCKIMYTFQNTVTLQRFTGTRFEFQEFTGINRKLVSCLFGKSPARVSKGWRLLNPPSNLQIINKEK